MATILEEKNNRWNEDDYFEKRLYEQIRWYSKKSKSAKNWYTWISIALITSSAVIPPLSTYSQRLWIRLILILVGCFSSIASGYLCLTRAQEKWITYRITAENLKREEVLYKTGIFPYCFNAKNRLEVFIQNAENIMATENASWLKVASKTIERKDCENG